MSMNLQNEMILSVEDCIFGSVANTVARSVLTIEELIDYPIEYSIRDTIINVIEGYEF